MRLWNLNPHPVAVQFEGVVYTWSGIRGGKAAWVGGPEGAKVPRPGKGTKLEVEQGSEEHPHECWLEVPDALVRALRANPVILILPENVTTPKHAVATQLTQESDIPKADMQKYRSIFGARAMAATEAKITFLEEEILTKAKRVEELEKALTGANLTSKAASKRIEELEKALAEAKKPAPKPEVAKQG